MNSIDSYLRARDYTSSSISASNFSTPEGAGDSGKVYSNGYKNDNENNNNSGYNGYSGSNSAYASSPVAVKTTVVPKSNGDYGSSTFQNDEDWVTKKRVETVTTKSQVGMHLWKYTRGLTDTVFVSGASPPEASSP